MRGVGFFKRLLIKSLFPLIRRYDKDNVKNIQNIISISRNVQERVKNIYNRESDIIFPLVDVNRFKFISSGDFYFSSARLTPDKRVDVIVDAFKDMPDKKLIVASGGSDLDKIKKLADGYGNISVLGWVSDEKLAELYGTCVASIAASYFEDFGMIATESMAAGKPVIASGDKGFAESIVDGETGILIDPTKSEIVKAVNKLDKRKALSMRYSCEKRAKLFSKEVFVSKVGAVVREEIERSK